MHGIKTIHRLNAEACEAQRILNARNPGGSLAGTPEANQVAAQIREQRAKAQETIAKITAPTH